MKQEDPIYFIKFGLQEDYLKELVEDGGMFMNCARYYAFREEYEGETEFGDLRECLALGIVRKLGGNALYCMYSVFPNDIVFHNSEKCIRVSSRAINLFCRDYKKYAVFSAKGLISIIENCCIRDKVARVGQIRYYESTSLEEERRLLADNTGDIAFRKQNRYSYQQEMRILLYDIIGTDFSVVLENEKPVLYMREGERSLDDIEQSKKPFVPYKGKKYYVGSLANISTILSFEDMKYYKGYYYIPLSKILQCGYNDA